MRKSLMAAAVAALAIGMSSAASFAATIYATSVVAVAPGTYQDGVTPIPALPINGTPTNGSRLDPDNALGAPDGQFYSLGFGGSIDLGYSGLFHSGAVVVEITGGTYPNELALLFVSTDGTNWSTSVNVVSSGPGNPRNINVTLPAGQYQFVRLTDSSNIANFSDSVADGFDLDAIGVTAVPLPAAAWGGMALLGGIGAIRAIRRRK